MSSKTDTKLTARRPEAADIPALQALWRESFAEDRSGPFVPWYFAHRFRREDCWLLEGPQGEPAAMCFAPAVTFQTAQGERLEIPYIQGVATAPQSRRQGLCRRLLEIVEGELAARGAAFCVLKPFDAGFYQPLGYRFFAYLRRYNLDLAEHFLLPPESREQKLRLEHYLSPAAGAEAAAHIYQKWCQLPAGPRAYARRSPDWFALLLADHKQDGGQMLLARTPEGEPLAYALYSPTDKGLFLRELAFARAGAARYLLRALAADYREDTPAAVLIAPDNPALCAPLPQTLAGWQVLPFAMLKPLTKGWRECYNMVGSGYFYEYF